MIDDLLLIVNQKQNLDTLSIYYFSFSKKKKQKRERFLFLI